MYVSSAMGAGGDRIGKERWGASYEVGVAIGMYEISAGWRGGLVQSGVKPLVSTG